MSQDIHQIVVRIDGKGAKAEVKEIDKQLSNLGTNKGTKNVTDNMAKVKDSSAGALSGVNLLKGGLATIGGALSVGAMLATFQQIADAMGQLTDKAGELGTDTSTLQMLFAQFGANGLNVMKTTKAMQNLNTAVRELENGTDKGIDAFKRLGLSAGDILGKDMLGQLQAIKTATASLGTTTVTMKGLEEIFGKGLASKVLPTLGTLETDLTKINEIIVDPKTVSVWDDMGDAMERLKRTGLAGLANMFKDMAKDTKTWADAVSDGMVVADKAGGGNMLTGALRFAQNQSLERQNSGNTNILDWTLSGLGVGIGDRGATAEVKIAKDRLSGKVNEYGDIPSEPVVPRINTTNKDDIDYVDATLKTKDQVIVKLSEEIRLEKELAEVKKAGMVAVMSLEEKAQSLRLDVAKQTQEVATQQELVNQQLKDGVSTDEQRKRLVKEQIELAKMENSLSANLYAQKEQHKALAELILDIQDSALRAGKSAGAQELVIRNQILAVELKIAETKMGTVAYDKAQMEKAKLQVELMRNLNEQENKRKEINTYIASFGTEQTKRDIERLEAIKKIDEALKAGLITNAQQLDVITKINDKYENYSNKSIGELGRTIRDPNSTADQKASAQKAQEALLQSGKVGTFDALREGGKDAVNEWGSQASQMVEIGRTTVQNLESGFTTFFTDIANGSKSAGQAFADFGSMVLQELEKMMIQALIVKPLMAGLMGAMGVSTAPAPVAVGHTGGTVGEGGTIRRFHSGGIVGDEVPIIAKRGEKITAQQDTTGSQAQRPVQILNNFDMSMIGRYISENPQLVVNVIGANRGRVKAVLG